MAGRLRSGDHVARIRRGREARRRAARKRRIARLFWGTLADAPSPEIRFSRLVDRLAAELACGDPMRQLRAADAVITLASVDLDTAVSMTPAIEARLALDHDPIAELLGDETVTA